MYGITIEEKNQKLKFQNNKCDICEREFKKGSRINIDHIHVKGFKKMKSEEKRKYIRALLCFRCNRALGGIEREKEPRKFLQAIIRYSLRWKLKNDPINEISTK